MPLIRRMLTVLVLLLVLGLGIIAGTMVWLSRWIPTSGKAWVEGQIERQWPVDASLVSIAYRMPNRLVIDDLTVAELRTSAAQLHATRATIDVGLIALALRRQAAVRVEAVVDVPVRSTLTLAGQYDVRRRDWRAEITTDDVTVAQLAPQLRALLPAWVREGTIRSVLEFTGGPGQALLVDGRIDAQDLRIRSGAIEGVIRGDARGHATLPMAEPKQWRYDITASVDDAQWTGLPRIDRIEHVRGALHLTQDRLEANRLTGDTLGATWSLEGMLWDRASGIAELLATASVPVDQAAKRFASPTIQGWQPAGRAEVRLRARGAPTQWPVAEVTVHAAISQGRVQVPNLASPLDRIAGVVVFDYLSRTIRIDDLTAMADRAGGEEVAARVGATADRSHGRLDGTILAEKIPKLNLTLETSLDLGLFAPLLAAKSLAVSEARGPAQIDVAITGTTRAPVYRGTAILDDTTARLRGWTNPLEHVRGTIQFSNHELGTSQVRLTFRDQDVTLSGLIQGLPHQPSMNLRAKLQGGDVALQTRATADTFFIEQARLRHGSSELQATGQLSRSTDQRLTATISGTVELADLVTLPWKPLRSLETWQLQGPVQLRLRLAGPARRPADLSALGFIQSPSISIRQLPLRALSAEFERQPESLSLRITNAQIAEGRLAGEFWLKKREQGSEMLLECDLTQANLDQLTRLAPTWRGKPLDGIITSHLSIMGNPADRASLHGDGWIQATGEHLAELPLLKRLLSGLFGVLADRLGLSALRTAQIREAAVQWRLADGRFSTDDLRLSGLAGTEPMTINAQGSVGLDRTLDFTVEPQLSEQLMLEAPNTSMLASTVLKLVGSLERIRRLVGRHHLTGTLDNPDYRFEFSVQQLFGQTLPAGVGRLLESTR